MNLTLIGLIILFTAYAANRFIMTKATEKLADEEKLKIFDAFSKRNNITTVLILILIVIYFGAIMNLPHFIVQITAVYLFVYGTYLIFRFISNYKKLKQLQISSAYIKSFITSYSLFILGCVGMSFCVFWNWLN